MTDEIQGQQMSEEVIHAVIQRVQDKLYDEIDETDLHSDAPNTLREYTINDKALLKATIGDISSDFEKFVGGQMDRIELMESTTDKAANYIYTVVEKTVTGLATAEFGVLAPKIGALAGYVAGGLFRDAAAPFINAAKRAKFVRERYETLHGFYEQAIITMQQQRQTFEFETTALFERRQVLIEECFQELDSALTNSDVDKASNALNKISNEFGRELTFKAKKDFDEFILNSDDDLVL